MLGHETVHVGPPVFRSTRFFVITCRYFLKGLYVDCRPSTVSGCPLSVAFVSVGLKP